MGSIIVNVAYIIVAFTWAFVTGDPTTREQGSK